MERHTIRDLILKSQSIVNSWLYIFDGVQSIDDKTIDIANDEIFNVANDIKSVCDFIIDTKDSLFLPDLSDLRQQIIELSENVWKVCHQKQMFLDRVYEEGSLKVHKSSWKCLFDNCLIIEGNIRDAGKYNNYKMLLVCKAQSFENLFPEESKKYFDRLVKGGYCNNDYTWKEGTKYHAAQAAHNISKILWGENKWSPFEKLWGMHNLAQTFIKITVESKKTLKQIDNLFPENDPPKK